MLNLLRKWFSSEPELEPEPKSEHATEEKVQGAEVAAPKPTWQPRERPSISRVDASLRLSEWRRNEALVSQMRQFLAGQFGRDVISCLVNECRVQQGLPQPNPEVVAIELGRIAGHDEVIDMLILMGEPIKEEEQIPMTWKASKAFQRED